VICPICNKHKAKRLCPAKAETICTTCCGREREVTIDCPSDCVHLMASRQFGEDKKEINWSEVPFPEERPSQTLIGSHQSFILDLFFAIGRFATENPALVDSDAQGSLQALAETYRTLASGIYFERAPQYRIQRELYDRMKGAIAEFKKEETRDGVISRTRDFELRDCLVFLAQTSVIRSNGRPKGRAFLDFIRGQFDLKQFSKSSSSAIVLP